MLEGTIPRVWYVYARAQLNTMNRLHQYQATDEQQYQVDEAKQRETCLNM